MPHVTVTLKHTPKPDDDVVFVEFAGDPEGLAVHFGHGRVWIEPDDLSSSPSLTPAEALALARALALVAGCADPHWRGFHWRAEEANGNLLGETPLGEWYRDKRDAVQAIRTLFGYGVRVVLSDDTGHAGLLRSAYDSDTIDPEPHPTAADTPEATPDAAWWCKRCDSENAFETCWFCKEPKPADDTPEAEQ